MASACVNNIGMSPAAKTYPSYGWLSPRISFSREEDHRHHHPQSKPAAAAAPEGSDGPDPAEPQDPVDFEFRLDDPVTMLPADELFSDGKLVPLHINAPPPNVSTAPKPSAVNGLSGTRTPTAAGVRSPEQEQQQQPNRSCRRMELEISGTDAYLFSPKAPRCSSRWKELLGLKKLYQNPSTTAQKPDKTTSSSSSSTTTHTAGTSTTNPKSLKHFLHRSSKPCSCSVSLDHTLSLPLLKDSDYLDSVSISSSRLSLSSSSSSHDHEDLPRLSLDAAEKPSSTTTATTTAATATATHHHPSPNPFVLNRAAAVASRVRMVKARSSSATCESNNGGGRVGRSPMRREEAAAAGESCSRGVSVDSPRMNSSGKIVFQSLERSSSSPSTFNGGPRLKHRGMERSYSANVRVTPVLNVPVCSLRGSSKSFGFGQLFSSSPQKREGINNNKGQHHHHHHHHHHHQLQQQQSNSRNRTDRT